MPNPNPSPSTRFQPVDAAYVSRSFRLRPDQVKRLALEENQSAVVRAALDAWFSTHASTMKTLSEAEEYRIAQQIARLLDSDNPGDRLAASMLLREHDVDEVWIETARIEAKQRAGQQSE